VSRGEMCQQARVCVRKREMAAIPVLGEEKWLQSVFIPINIVRCSLVVLNTTHQHTTCRVHKNREFIQLPPSFLSARSFIIFPLARDTHTFMCAITSEGNVLKQDRLKHAEK
jgi:hypothetical protein